MAKSKLIFPLFFFFLALFSYQYFSSSPKLKVVKVVDGDTIKLSDGRTIRYLNLDTPELAKGEAEDDCFAQEAKEISQHLVLGKEVRLEFDVNEMDRFGRYLAYVYVLDEREEIFVNQYLLEQGAGEFFLDTVNLKYQHVLIKAAEKGHKEKKGLWKKCAEDPKAGCIIKGNLDKWDKRRYHLPYFRHYPQIVMRLEQGDRWFCTEEEAIKAGFKRARE